VNDHFAVGFFPFIVLLIIYFSAMNRYEKIDVQHRSFVWLLLVSMLLVLVDGLAWMLDGAGYVMGQAMVYAVNMALFLLTPICIFFFYYYLCMLLSRGENSRRLKWPGAFLSVSIGSTAMVLLNVFTGWLFYVDASARYVRGDLLWLYAALCYAQVLIAYLLMIKYRKVIPRQHLMVLLLAPVLPITGVLLQLLLVSQMWGSFCMAISALLIFVNIQNQFSNTDYLTGVNNRRQLDDYIRYRIRYAGKSRTFAVVLIDLNRFKIINDTLGHSVGDQAIRDAAALLKQCIRQDDFIARYGGDEFFLVLNVGTYPELKKMVRRIKSRVEEFNRSKQRPYTLEFAMGYELYDRHLHKSAKDLVAHVDMLMYEDKNSDSQRLALTQQLRMDD
jgi:diguanylate cyclase (GGDEF)-like protein